MTTIPNDFDYDIFISYARKDGADIAQRVHDSLRDHGLRVFLDQHHIQHGEEWWRRITESIRRSKLFVFIITEHSVTSSVCADEWNTALDIPRPILTVKVVDDSGHIIADGDIPDHISRINYVNATQMHQWDDLINAIQFHVTRYSYLYELADDLAHAVSENTARRFIEIVAAENRDSKKQLKRRMRVRTLRQDTETTQEFSNLDEAWQAYNGQVLLLGHPGAGKTTTLLHHAQTLIRDYLTDRNQKLPVFASIAYWDSYANTPLHTWLPEHNELSDDIAEVIRNGRAVLILDGLDELGSDKPIDPQKLEKGTFDPRQRFMAHVQQAIHEGNQVLITCRVHDYNAIGEKLDIRGAIELQPLTDTQIETYLGDVPTVQTAVMSDADLRDICRSPLLLSLIAFGYRDATDDLKALPSMTESNDLRDAIFGQYIQASYDFEASRRELLGEEMPFTLEKVLDVLGHAAMINVAGGRRDYRLSAILVSEERIVENILIHGDFSHELENEDIEEFLELVSRLNIIEWLEDKTYRFLHLLIRDYLAYRQSLKLLQRGLLVADIDLNVRLLSPESADYQPSDSRVLSCLIKLNEVRATPFLLQIIRDDDNQSVRKSCVSALGFFGVNDVVPTLVKLMQEDSDNEIRSISANALGRIGDPQAVPALINALRKDPDEILRRSTAIALGRIGDPQAVPALISALQNDSNYKVQVYSASALGEIGDSRAISALADATNYDVDTLFQLAYSASDALENIGIPEALEMIPKWYRQEKDHTTSDTLFVETAISEEQEPFNTWRSWLNTSDDDDEA